jgi:pyrimidine-specific ribonucleoside hydrolase
MKKKLLLIIISLQVALTASPHYKAAYHVLIDTDGGPGDFRAICMLLAAPEVEVIAITCTDGTLPPDSSWSRVTALLHSFGHEGIPVGRGNRTAAILPEPSNRYASLVWTTCGRSPLQSVQEASALIHHAVRLEDRPVDFIALGPLGNLAEALDKYPGLDTSLRKLVWFNGSLNEQGINYRLAPSAADHVLGSGLAVEMIGNEHTATVHLPVLMTALYTLDSEYAGAIKVFHAINRDFDKEQGETISLAEELIPLKLVYPELFENREIPDDLYGSRSTGVVPLQPSFFLEKTVELLDTDREDKSIVFKGFPYDPDLLEEDVRAVSDEIRSRHGLKEWKITVLTNEFHEHLGIYSIIGAKMGLRAREFFNIGIDELVITSHAGLQPPVSCMNDGLQVSTGATLGHGMITVADGQALPEAVFRFKDQSILIRLKDEHAGRIRGDIRKAVETYGLNTDEYWLYVRELALGYWLELGRKEIFIIERLSPL